MTKKNTARRVAALVLASGLALQPLAWAAPAYAEEAVASSDESATTEASQVVEMFRLYNKWTGEHLYTSSTEEVAKLKLLGWKDEGIAWYAPATSSTPVYRLYNPYCSDHHYTTSKDEYDKCAERGWRKEGIAWYSADSKSTPLYRGFNPYEKVGTHHYTASSAEMSKMTEAGWRAEGVAWYGLRAVDKKTWVVDQEAYDEPVYEEQTQYVCSQCGKTFSSEEDYMSHDAYDENFDSTWHTEYIHIQTGTIHHDEVGHWETVTEYV